MALPRVTAPVNNISSQPVQPVIGASALQALFDEIGKDLKDYTNNELLPSLESTTDGNSGLDNIGMTPIAGLTATTPQEALEEINAKSPINIANGSITDLKLSNDTGQIKDVVATHTRQISDFCINVNDFGAIGDGVADDTIAIQNAINAASDGNTVFFPNEKYVVSNITPKSNLKFYGNSTIIFKSGTTGIQLNFSALENIRIIDLKFDGLDTTVYSTGSSAGNRSCIKIDNLSKRIDLTNVTIKGFTNVGVDIRNVGYVDKSFGITLNNVFVENCYIGFAFTNRGEYCKGTTIESTKCRYGIVVGAGNIHIGSSMFNENVDACQLTTGSNDAHGSFVGCTFNHNSQYGLLATDILNGHTFIGCHFYDNDIYLNNTKGIQITNGQIGQPANIYIKGGGYNQIKNNILNGTVSIFRGFGGVPDVSEISNNIDLDGISATSLDGLLTELVCQELTVATFSSTTQIVFTPVLESLFNQSRVGIIYNSTTGDFTAHHRGEYNINVIVKFNNTVASNNTAYMSVRVNELQKAYDSRFAIPSSTNNVMTINTVLTMNAGDVLKIEMFSTSAIQLVSSESVLLITEKR